jgi:hypothetical protein
MDKLPTDIQYMIIKDLNPTSLVTLIENNQVIKDIVKETMNSLIKDYIDKYNYEYYLWEDNNTIDDFIENLKIRRSMEPINNHIINEVLLNNPYEKEHIQKIDDIRHLKMFSMLIKRLNIDYDDCFYLHYRDYKDPEKYEQEYVNDRIHFMYEIIKRYPTFVELPEDTSEYHINNFDDIYELDDNNRKMFIDTVDEYILRGCHPFYIIDSYFLYKETFDYYLNKGFSPMLSYTITFDFRGRTDISDEKIFKDYGRDDSIDKEFREEIKEYMRNKSNKN